jgi:hypothetical protein
MTSEIFSKRYFILPRAEIGHLRFILESYEGLAFARTLDKQRGLVEIAYSPSRALDVESLLKDLIVEVSLQEAEVPEQVPPI